MTTADTPTIKIPPGFELKTNPDGSIDVVKIKGARTKTVSFRVTAREFEPVLPYVQSFPNGMSDAFRALLTDERVLAVMRERVTATTRPRKRGQQ